MYLRLLLLLEHHCNMFLAIFNLVNSQASYTVNLSKPLIPVVALVFWNTSILPPGNYPQYLQTRKEKLEKFANFRFIQIINICSFSYDDDKTQTQNPLISTWKPKRLCFPLGIKVFWVWLSSLLWFTCVLHFTHLCLVEFLSNKQCSLWIFNQ